MFENDKKYIDFHEEFGFLCRAMYTTYGNNDLIFIRLIREKSGGWQFAARLKFLAAKRCSDCGRKKKRTLPGCGWQLSALQPTYNSAQFFTIKYHV